MRTGVRPGSGVPGHTGRHRRPPRHPGRWALVAGVVALLVVVAAVVVPRLGGDPAAEPPASAPVDTGDLTSPDERDVAMQLVASAENATLDWRAQYGYVEWDVEGVPAGNETEWLHAFLDARVAAMRTEQAHLDTTRVGTAQRVFLQDGNLHLDPPLSWSVYGDDYEIG